MAIDAIQYLSDESGKPVGVLVPIDIWREIESERETALLLSSPAMRERLLAATNRSGGLTIEEVSAKLGL